MINKLTNELLLIWPGLFTLILLVASVMPRSIFKHAKKLVDILFHLFTLIGIPNFVPSVAKKHPFIVTRVLFIFLSIILLVCIPFRNYAGFFPTDFTIKIFFDEQGIREALKEFNERELKRLNLEANWSASRNLYFNRLDGELKKRGLNFEFGKPDNMISGVGLGSIRATQVEGWDLQVYDIVEAKGEITLTRREPPAGPLSLYTWYELRPSSANRINLDILDIYSMTPLVIMPEFYQNVYLNPTQRYTEHFLTTATKIRFLPMIQIGTTLYLYTQPDGTRIPVGYAIYEPVVK